MLLESAIVPGCLANGRVLTVALAGGDFTTVKAACDSVTDASAAKTYVIRVSPGIYVEPPFTIPSYVTVMGMGVWDDSCTLQTDNDAANFINLEANATLAHVAVSGPADPGCATIDYVGTGYGPGMLYHVVIKKGYYGLHVHPASYGLVHCHEVVNRYAGAAINQFVRVTNGVVNAISSSFMSGPSGSCVTGFYVSGATAKLTMDLCAFRGPGATDAVMVDNGALCRLTGCSLYGADDAIHADNGADVQANSCVLDAGVNGIHTGANGAGTRVNGHAIQIGAGFTKDIYVEVATTTLSVTGSAHVGKLVVQAGATFSANLVDDAANVTLVHGDLILGENLFPVSKFVEALRSTGVYQGGGLELVSGLTVKVLAGRGLVENALSQLLDVIWVETEVTLPANTNKVWLVVGVAGTVSGVATTPDLAKQIVIGSCNTGATDVRFVADHAVDLPQPSARLYDYLTEVVGPINVSGCLTTKHAATSLELNVSDGVYYIHNHEALPVGVSPVTFSYWYRDGAGKWKVVASQTAIDSGYYDNNTGTLAAVPGGKYKRDLLFVSCSGSGTAYHVVYGQVLYDTAIAAVDNPLPPDVLLNEACRLAALVVLQGAADIATVVDQRPKLGQLAASFSGGITHHGDLLDLLLDQHTQYQLRTEKGLASGYVGLDGAGKIAAGYLSLATAAPPAVTVTGAAVGSGTKLAKEDHGHSVTTATPGTLTFGSAVEGTAVSLARSDHEHALTAPSAPADVSKTAAAAGTSVNVAREDHKHGASTAAPAATSVGTTAAEGSATSLARSDHAHQSNTAPVNVTKAAAAIGTSGEPARADHKHDTTTAAPGQGIGASNSEGSSTSLSRADHGHTIRETGGPTDLTVGVIAADQALVRSGTVIVGKSRVREAFFLAEPSANLNNMRVRNVGTNGTYRFDFSVPMDFGSLVSLELLGVPTASNAAANIDLASNYAAVGQSPTTFTGSNTTATYALVSGILVALNLSPVVASLGAGHQGGVLVTHNSVGGSVDYYGIRLRYNPA
jgi:hypothetical protein